MAYIGKNPKLNTLTYTPQSTEPSNPTEGMQYYDDGTNRPEGLYTYKNGVWVLGESSGSLDIFYKENFESTLLASITSGNNASFDNGGSFAGTLAYETASPLSGDKSLKYTLAAGSTNDWIKFPAETLEVVVKGNRVIISGYYTYNGNANDLKLVLWDDTNNVDLLAGSGKLSVASNAKRFEFSAVIPSNASSFAVGLQTLSAVDGAILVIDNIQGTTEPIRTQDFDKLAEPVRYLAPTGTINTNTTYYLDFPTLQYDDDSLVSGNGLGNKTVTNTGWKYIVPKKGKYRIKVSAWLNNASWSADEYLRLMIFVNNSIEADFYDIADGTGNASKMAKLDATLSLNEGDRIEIGLNQTSGNNVALVASADSTFVEVQQIPDKNSRNSNITYALEDVQPVKYKSAGNQTMTSGIVYYMDFPTKVFDDQGLVTGAGSGNTSTQGGGWKYNVPSKGKYEINAHLFFANDSWSVNTSMTMRAYVNGVLQNLAYHYITASGSFNTAMDFSLIVEANAGDYIEVAASHNSGSNKGTTGSPDTNWVEIKKIDQNALAAVPGIQFQKKVLPANLINPANGAIAALTFNNLEIGKAYRATLQAGIIINSADTAIMDIVHDGIILGRIVNAVGAGDHLVAGTQAVFIATATTVTFVANSFSSSTLQGIGDGSFGATWSMLEELPAAIEVTKW